MSVAQTKNQKYEEKNLKPCSEFSSWQICTQICYLTRFLNSDMKEHEIKQHEIREQVMSQ